MRNSLPKKNYIASHFKESFLLAANVSYYNHQLKIRPLIELDGLVKKERLVT